MAAIACCTPATAKQAQDEPEQPVRRQPVRGGGPTQHDCAPRVHAGPGRLEQALHLHCQPGAQLVLPPLLGGGPAAAVVPGTQQMPADPALVALAVLLGDAAPTDVKPSVLRQLGAQLASLLAVAAERVRVVLPSGGERAAAEAGSQPAARADAPVVPQQPLPPPPPGPLLTLDPRLGTIVDASPPGGPDDGASGIAPSSDHEIDDGADEPLVPSSWVPVAIGRLRQGTRAGIGAIVDRIDALLRELGISRLQLLLLTIAAPLAVAFAIDVVSSILEGR